MITITQDLLQGYNPAYNNNIIRYNSSITGITKSVISVSGNSFTVYPINNEFSFNLKDIAKVLVNQNGFTDTIIPDLNADFIYDDSNLTCSIDTNILVTGSTTGESMTKTFKFFKGVEQLPNYNSTIQNRPDIVVTLPTDNYYDYNLVYFEGYPIDFGIRGLNSGDTFHFKNAITGMQSSTFNALNESVKRIYLSDGATNETINNILPLSSSKNTIELWVNNQFKCNINVSKIESRCGVYLKWFNKSGGYSYWLFDNVYKESIKTKDFAEIQGSWDNLQNIKSTSESLGKSTAKSIQLTTNFKNENKEFIIQILDSPKVEMYIHQEPFVGMNEFDFLGVKVADESFNFSNKNSNNKLIINLELPNINNVTY